MIALTSPFLSGATFRGIPYRTSAGLFTSTPLGYIVHVPQSNGSLYGYFAGLTAPRRKFSTAFVFKDGSAEQYTELFNKSWAQADGNPLYWSFEIEGFDSEPMTREQLITLARWHRELNVAKTLAEAPGEAGIGTHAMGGKAWGGHSCPGMIRSAQRADILTIVNGGPAPKSPKPTPTPTYPAFPGYVRLGSTGRAVVTVQRKFVERGWRLTVDGIAGPATIAVVKSFQREKGLGVDGVVGPNTWHAMWTYPTATGKI